MARPKNKPRTTPKKQDRKQSDIPDLKERPDDKKTVDLENQIADLGAVTPPFEPSDIQDETIEEDDTEPVEYRFKLGGEIFRYADIDEDVLGAIEAFSLIETGAQGLKDQVRLIIHHEDYDRFAETMRTETMSLLQARQEWKAADPDERGEEPITVRKFSANANTKLFSAYTDLLRSNPKGSGS